MHILTKILVVLVALLVVALVPLAAVSSTNQLTFKQKATDAESSLRTEQANAKAAQDMWTASMAALRTRNETLSNQLTKAQGDVDAERQARTSLEARVETLSIEVAELQGQANQLVANAGVQTRLIQEYSQQIDGARTKFLDSEKQKVELQTALDRAQADLENETTAKRFLQEQLQKMTEDRDRTAADLSRMSSQYGSPISAGAASDAKLPVPADRTLTASVVSVDRRPDCTMAEISVGSRDGVKEGWVLALSDEAGNFTGNLRITDVDVNHSVGVVELENTAVRKVSTTNRAHARKGV